jgi:hypothetical protein
MSNIPEYMAAMNKERSMKMANVAVQSVMPRVSGKGPVGGDIYSSPRKES